MRQNKGFTLIELLVVIVILGILGAIAVPQLMAYRDEGYCGRAVTDARHAFTAMEAYYSENLTYGPLADAGFTSSDKVTVSLISTDPLVISATDDSNLCPKGGVYTLSNQSGTGDWS